MTESSLVIFTRAALMLAEADTIQKAKELKDLALTAADWAKRKGMGEEAIKYARSYALEAERKMGEMLRETERAIAGRPPINQSLDVTNYRGAPTLSDLGLTKRESSEAQMLAALPQETFEAVKTGEKTLTQVKKDKQKEVLVTSRSKLAELGKSVYPDDRWQVELGDINVHILDRRYDFIITDPPYGYHYLELYGVLAERAIEWLTPNGLVLVMCGQSYLDQIMSLMSVHLRYYWMGAYLTPGQPTPLHQRQVNTTWKPILIFGTPEYKGKIFGDVWRSDGNDKDFHQWGQSVSGMLSIISQVCLPRQRILDPFCGAGTTGVAALKHGCLFTGLDVSEENVNIARARLSEVLSDQKTV